MQSNDRELLRIRGDAGCRRDGKKLPDFAVGMCTLRIEDAAPKSRAVLLRAADGKELPDDESLLLFRGLHILGGARRGRARVAGLGAPHRGR